MKQQLHSTSQHYENQDNNQDNQCQESNSQNYAYTEAYVWGSKNQLYMLKNFNKMVPKMCSFSIAIKKVSCGHSHAGLLSYDGYLYMMGANNYGQLGSGSQSEQQIRYPSLVEALIQQSIEDFSCGDNHVIAISQKGKAYSWGQGKYGALGINHTSNQFLPVLVPKFTKIKIISVSCGTKHSLFINNKGQVFVCGDGKYGQLGNGQNSSLLEPELLKTLKETIFQVSAGQNYSLLLTQKGEVYSNGYNLDGRLGLGHQNSINVPQKIEQLSQIIKVSCHNNSLALSSDGDLYHWGSSILGVALTPKKVTSIPNSIADLEQGINMGAAIDNTGITWVWGENLKGELGVGDKTPRNNPYPLANLNGKQIISLSIGSNFSIALGKTQINKKAKNNEIFKKYRDSLSSSQNVLDEQYRQEQADNTNKQQFLQKFNSNEKNSSDYVNKLKNELQNKDKKIIELQQILSQVQSNNKHQDFETFNHQNNPKNYSPNKKTNVDIVLELNQAYQEIKQIKQENVTYIEYIKEQLSEINDLKFESEKLRNQNQELYEQLKQQNDLSQYTKSEIDQLQNEISDIQNKSQNKEKDLEMKLEQSCQLILDEQYQNKQLQTEVNQLKEQVQQLQSELKKTQDFNEVTQMENKQLKDKLQEPTYNKNNNNGSKQNSNKSLQELLLDSKTPDTEQMQSSNFFKTPKNFQQSRTTNPSPINRYHNPKFNNLNDISKITKDQEQYFKGICNDNDKDKKISDYNRKLIQSIEKKALNKLEDRQTSPDAELMRMQARSPDMKYKENSPMRPAQEIKMKYDNFNKKKEDILSGKSSEDGNKLTKPPNYKNRFQNRKLSQPNNAKYDYNQKRRMREYPNISQDDLEKHKQSQTDSKFTFSPSQFETNSQFLKSNLDTGNSLNNSYSNPRKKRSDFMNSDYFNKRF